MRSTIQLFCISLLLLAAGIASAEQDPIGKVQSLKGNAIAANAGVKRELATKADVFAQDMVATGNDSFMQIMFADGTILALDADSMVELRDFAYEVGNADQSRLDLNMVSGALRFLSGQVAKYNPEEFKVETPLGVIGIRGTEGLASTELADPRGFANTLSRAMNSPGTAWNQPEPPQVNGQTVVHVNGSPSKAMTFTDFNNRTVSLSRGQAVNVSGQTGAGDPRDITPQDRQRMKSVDFSTSASTPYEYRHAARGSGPGMSRSGDRESNPTPTPPAAGGGDVGGTNQDGW